MYYKPMCNGISIHDLMLVKEDAEEICREHYKHNRNKSAVYTVVCYEWVEDHFELVSEESVEV